jgi:hypothetical protein
MKGVIPWLVSRACHDITRDFCPALVALVAQYKIYTYINIFFLTVLYFTFYVPIAQQAGQAMMQGSPVS